MHGVISPEVNEKAQSGSAAVKFRERIPASVRQSLLPLVVLIILVAVVVLKSPGFLSPGSIGVQLAALSPILLLAIGQTLVILTGGIDLSSAAIAAFSTIMVALWLPSFGALGVVGAVAVTAIIGCINGLVHVGMQVPSFVVTLGSLGVVTGLAQVVSGNQSISIVENYGVIEWMSDRFGFLPTEAIIALLLAAGVGLGLKFVRGGPFVRAVGFGELPSLIAGVPTKAVKVIVFTLSGTMAGLAGVILASQNIGGDPGSAQSLLMPSIAAVLVGGTLITGGRGGLGRTVLGVAVIIVLRNGLAVMGVPDSYTQLIYGTVVIVAVALSVDRTPGRIVA